MDEKKRSAGSRKAVLVATLGLACGAAAVMLVAAKRPMPSVDMSSLNAALQGVTTDTAVAAPAATDTAAAASAPAAPVADVADPAPVRAPAPKRMAKAPVSAPRTVAAKPLEEPVAPTPQVLAVAPEAREEAPAPVVEAQVASVTINGCLERDGDLFRLKNIEGQDAPKARSWRSGFLRKGKPKIDVIDATNRLKLTEHVGHRVSVTGMLEDKEMQAKSISRVATYCE